MTALRRWLNKRADLRSLNRYRRARRQFERVFAERTAR